MNEATLRTKTDWFIANILDQKENYSAEVVNLAKEIYAERNLDSPQKQSLIKNIHQIKRHVFLKMERGDKPSEVMEFLISKGLTEKEAKDIAIQSIEKLKKVVPEKSESKGSIIFIVLVVFFVIKLMANFF